MKIWRRHGRLFVGSHGPMREAEAVPDDGWLFAISSPHFLHVRRRRPRACRWLGHRFEISNVELGVYRCRRCRVRP